MSRSSTAGVLVLTAVLVACSSGATESATTQNPTTESATTSISAAGSEASSDAPTGSPGAGIPTDSTPSSTSTASGSPSVPTPAPRPTEPSATDLLTGLEAPWSVAFVDGTALVSERDSGRILEIDEVAGSSREVAVIDGVQHGGEGGLLGLAVDDQRRLYVYSTTAEGNRVQRYPISGTAGSLALGEPEIVIDGIPAGRTHNGGRIAFGPDGMLYVTVGDAQNREAAQDVGSVSGKILRLTPEGAVPDDNPFPGSPVYSLGHRNPQGLGWAADGTFWAAEFGQDTWDELNVITAGANYGWPEVEGIGGVEGFVDPVAQWGTDDASPSGLAVDGDRVQIANLKGASLRSVPTADPGAEQVWFDDEYGRLRDVVVAPDGRLWVLTNNTDGRGNPVDGDDRILVVDVP